MKSKTAAFALIAILTFILAGCGGETESPVAPSTTVVIETTLGEITVELDAEKAPISVENFLSYVDESFYDGTIFHRVIPNFMIQGGGMLPDMSRKEPRPPIRNEADNGLNNDRGTVAMARTAAKDSATSQFFISVKDNVFLNHGARDFGYAVFGRVVEGMDVVDAIAIVGTRPGDVPLETISIVSVRRK